MRTEELANRLEDRRDAIGLSDLYDQTDGKEREYVLSSLAWLLEKSVEKTRLLLEGDRAELIPFITDHER